MADKKKKKAEMTSLVKILLWVMFSLVALAVVYYLFKFLGGII